MLLFGTNGTGRKPPDFSGGFQTRKHLLVEDQFAGAGQGAIRPRAAAKAIRRGSTQRRSPLTGADPLGAARIQTGTLDVDGRERWRSRRDLASLNRPVAVTGGFHARINIDGRKRFRGNARDDPRGLCCHFEEAALRRCEARILGVHGVLRVRGTDQKEGS